MTTVRFQRQGKGIRSVEFSGHAGYGEAGEDIVCAAVSSAVMLTDALLEDIWGLALEKTVEEKIPRIRLALPPDCRDGKAPEALEALRLHMQALKEEYPDFIQILEV